MIDLSTEFEAGKLLYFIDCVSKKYPDKLLEVVHCQRSAAKLVQVNKNKKLNIKSEIRFIVIILLKLKNVFSVP